MYLLEDDSFDKSDWDCGDNIAHHTGRVQCPMVVWVNQVAYNPHLLDVTVVDDVGYFA